MKARTADPTVAYYDEHAKEFLARTKDLPMDRLYEPFVRGLPAGGLILDVGCGTGRDAAAFRKMGFEVLPFDASAVMVEMCARATGLKPLHMRFADMAFREEFDGVWACASLIHVPKGSMRGILKRCSRALKESGIFFGSFRRGEGEEVQDGRFFSFYNELTLTEEMRRVPELRVQRLWITNAVRPEKRGEKWVNVIAKKRS